VTNRSRVVSGLAGSGHEVSQPALRRSRCLPGLRQTSQHAKAAFDDGSQNDAGAVSAAVGVTILVPIGRPELCENEISPGEEVRAGSQRVGRTEESGAESCTQDGGASVIVIAVSRYFASLNPAYLIRELLIH